MTIEEKVKELILERYSSIREFTIAIDMSYTTFDGLLKRGFKNANIKNVIQVCDALHISVDALADGEIKPRYKGDDFKNALALYLESKNQKSDETNVDFYIDTLDTLIEVQKKKR